MNVASAGSLLLLALAVVSQGQQAAMAHGLGLAGAGAIMGGAGSIMGGALNAIPGVMNSATNMVNGIAYPMAGAVNSLSGGIQSGLGGVLSSSLGGVGTLTGGEGGLLGNSLRLTSGALSGATAGLGNGLTGLGYANGLDNPYAQANALGANGLAGGLANTLSSAGHLVGGLAGAMSSAGGQMMSQSMHSNYKREALAEGAMVGAASEMMANSNSASLAGAALESAAEASSPSGLINGPSAAISNALVPGGLTASPALNPGTTGPASMTLSPLASPLPGRQLLAADALKNAQAESALAGAEMVQNGAINARSASLAGNAYRQAKLVGARDRVNIAGTIQNSARISDAAIATHDTATKAEDSLLGSELAVDSAGTVFDSDGAYIPPVTASLLRTLPYGRLGLRNIVPKPLTLPSHMLPDVWLNGVPVNYLNVPLKMLPNGIPIGPAGPILPANGQPFISNNGMILNGLVFDPAYAYMTGANINGIIGTSLLPILANGQLEAQDEIAMANLLNAQQMNGAGMMATYQGYGRLNPVPMITGSVSDANLLPTTTTGTTYPIGSALVIEPRDSFFQHYTDSASSRQNFDERQQS